MPKTRFVVVLVIFCAFSFVAKAEDPDLQFTKISDKAGIVDVLHADDGSGRLFLVDISGRIHIHQDGSDKNDPFLDISERVSGGGELGLLSAVFAPDYPASGYFYVWYSDNGGDTVLSRFKVSGNPDVADHDSEQKVLEVAQPRSNHNGGRLRFGPDGYLYLGLGDGGGSGDPDNLAQTNSTLLGKLIRIDVNPAHGTYAVPADNPFVNDPNVLDEIWASGLRNPWRISFDELTGELYIADVGQNLREEINVQPSDSAGGENYGWKLWEASSCFSGTCDQQGFTFPVFEYDHTQGCSITGGEVYRGLAYPNMHGKYFFADFCQRTVWSLQRNGDEWTAAVLGNLGDQVLSFGSGEDGSLYISGQQTGVYLLSDGEVVTEPRFAINPGMSDAWYNVDTPGQGFFIVVFEQIGQIFMAWFTFDTERPPQDVTAILGEPGHRWLTAQGAFSGNQATLDVFNSSGGVFDSTQPAVNPAVNVGTMHIQWSDCGNAVLTYELTSPMVSGQIPTQRIVSDNEALCEALQ